LLVRKRLIRTENETPHRNNRIDGSTGFGIFASGRRRRTRQEVADGDSRRLAAFDERPAEYFTGNVRVDPLFGANESAPYSGGYVTFEPGARSNWHTHPTGQRLIVTHGVGRTQEWGGPIVEVRAGDHIWCPPGVKHWHGASPTTAMTHIALTGTRDGKSVEWMEKVTDEQYGK
jgi:quercetin dioxygenase-like cupin family protein